MSGFEFDVRRFAEDTKVPIAKTRGQIVELLMAWKCSGISWADDFDAGRAVLGFAWKRKEQVPDKLHGVTHEAIYRVRFTVQIPTQKDIEAASIKAYPDGVRAARLSRQAFVRRELENAGRREHRLLLLKIKADLNAAAAGLAKAEEIFFPWMVGADGRTVAEALLPRMHMLLTNPAANLLGDGKGGD